MRIRNKLTNIVEQNELAREKFSGVQTNIQFMRLKEQNIKSIAITSSNKGEGKTFFSSNLAYTCSRFKQKTLLIDTDFHAPKLSKQTLPQIGEGLSNILIGDTDLENTVRPLTDYLDFVSIGVIPPVPLELLKTRGLQDLLDKALELYDIVIFDCPPISLFTDARIVSSICDLGLIVVDSEATTEAQVLNAKELLEDSGVGAVGAVLNKTAYAEKKYAYYGY